MAVIATETGISPLALLECAETEPGVFDALVSYLQERAEERDEQERREKLRRELGA